MIKSVLFVCTGNICRSPTADGILRVLAPHLTVDSAGTHGYHIGEPPDPRTIKAGISKCYDFSELRARKVEREDFNRFDLILAMDLGHYEHLLRMRPKEAKAELALFLEYAGIGKQDVDDPYYGSIQAFDTCLRVVEDACRKLLDKIQLR